MHTLFHADDLDVKIAYALAGIFSPRRPVSGKRCVEAARLIREKYPSVVALPALVAACEAMIRTHGMHGPCREHNCEDCHNAYYAAKAALRAAKGE